MATNSGYPVGWVRAAGSTACKKHDPIGKVGTPSTKVPQPGKNQTMGKGRYSSSSSSISTYSMHLVGEKLEKSKRERERERKAS